HAPLLLLETGMVVAIVLFVELAVQVPDASHVHIDARARRAVAVMLGQVQLQLAARYLHVDRRVRRKTVLPLDLAAEKIHIELKGLLQRENPEDRDGAFELDSHCSCPSSRSRVPNPVPEPNSGPL